MSHDGSSPSERLDTRYSTPAPELDDHRVRLPITGTGLTIPSVEVERATPQGSTMDPDELNRVDEALHRVEQIQRPDASPVVARDFEQAVYEDSGDEFELPGAARRGSTRNRLNKAARQYRHDRSRDTSTSRSTSPANSVEAFAEGRRRQRANTIDSRRSSVDIQRSRAYSIGTAPRRGTLSNISAPQVPTHRTDRDYADDVTFPTDDEPGKTYKIDFEELEEFVALSAQGKIAPEFSPSANGKGSVDVSTAFKNARAGQSNQQNVALNGENFYEASPESYTTSESQFNEKLTPKATRQSEKPAERFTFFSSESQHGIKATKLGDFTADGTTFRDLFEVGPEGGVWWLDVLNPTHAELEVISKAFKIHRLTREDIETQEAREKVELFSQYYFVCFRSFLMDPKSEDFLDPIHIYIIVCGDGVLSFSYTPNPHAKNVRKRISKLGDFVSLGPDYICYAMIDDIVDSFAPVIRDAEQVSENIEDQVFIARDDDFLALLRQIGECRKRVLNMMRLLGGKADVIKGFAKRCNEQYDMTPRGDIGLYLGDIQDHVVTMMSNLGHVEKMLSRSHANYLAQLNVEHILKGNHTNKTLARITVVATILVPLNLVTGLFGMNVQIPGRDVEGLQWFFGIIGFILLFVTVCLTIARRMRVI